MSASGVSSLIQATSAASAATAVGAGTGPGWQRRRRRGYLPLRAISRAVPKWTGAGVCSPMPAWRWTWLSWSKNVVQNVRASSMPPNRPGNAGQWSAVACTGVAGLAPLGDVQGVQALAAQQRATLPPPSPPVEGGSVRAEPGRR